MKNLLLSGFMLSWLLTGNLLAQDHQQAILDKMQVFENWAGHWRGEGSMRTGGGEQQTSVVDEYIEFKLGGMIVLVEGTGKKTDAATGQEKVVHHALAVLSFDPESGEYKFRTYLQDGRATDAWLKVAGQNKYQWGFDTPRGKVRYTITLDPAKKAWNETGEFSADGSTWRQFFEMDLLKVG